QRHRTLTLQYLQILEMDGAAKKHAILESLSKGTFRVKSSIQGKYDEKSKIKTLKKLISLGSEYREESAKRLLNDKWLDTTTIEAFFNLLEADYPVSVLSSDLAMKADFCDALKRRDRIFHYMQDKLKANRILWPMCDDTHWYLIVMNKRCDGRYDVFCLDSLNTKSSVFLKKAVDFLEAMYPEKENIIAKQEHIEIPKQDNDRDCGASICFWGERTARNKTMLQNKRGICDYSSFRKDIADRFAQKIHEDETPVILTSRVKVKIKSQ
ncbi:MAG TPA: Ulp1 family isopeptidase, partial [Candidatus Berkiella sp.]|nr:Ulp1 family isopeptidase [Candidatus Berkiella sp.]